MPQRQFNCIEGNASRYYASIQSHMNNNTLLNLEDDQYCFACGLNNPQGLQLVWKTQGRSTSAEFIPQRHFQGWKDLLHGGIISTLLDEAMTRLATEVSGVAVVTAEMTVRFVAPARIGELLLIQGEVVDDSRKIIEMKASLSDQSGKLLAYSTGKVMKVKGQQ